MKIEEKELRSVVEEIAYQALRQQPEWVGDQLDLSEEYLTEVLKQAQFQWHRTRGENV